MLSILRRNAGSWAIKIILSFIALTFIWWGVGTYSERDRNVAATVGGETITTSELSEAVANLEKTYREVYGAAFTPEMAKALNLKKQAMDSLVQRKILLAEAAKMGLSATDEEVQREIAAIPAFQQGGQFRDDVYRSVLSYNRVTPAEFEATKRVEITMKKIKDLVAAGALVPETEAKELFRVASRKVRLLVVSADPGKAKADAPTEGEILAKYEQGKERFRTPARVKLVVAAFTPDRFGREVNPSEAEIKAFHETNSDRFRTEERRLVSRIVLPFGKRTGMRSGRRPRRPSPRRRRGSPNSMHWRRRMPAGKTERRGSRARTPARSSPSRCSRPPWTPWSVRSNCPAASSSPA